MSARGKKNKQRARTKAHQVHLPVPPGPPAEDETPEAPVRWAADDAEAMWWDDVWPFRVEPDAEPPTPEEPEPSVEVARDGAEDVPTPEESPMLPGVWTVPADPEPEAGERGRQRWRRVVVGAALVAAVAIVAVAVWVETRPGPAAPEAARLTHADRYAAPGPLRPDTAYVRTRIRPSGGIEVTHWIRTAQPVRAVRLRMPEVAGLARGTVYVLHVVLAGDGVPVPVTKTVEAQGVTTIALPPTRHVFLRYRLAGVLQYAGTTGAADGADQRALARITALDVTTSRPLVHTTRTVTGVPVLALACGAPKEPVPVPCGIERRGTWSASLGPDQQHDQVLAQVDLSKRQR